MQSLTSTHEGLNFQVKAKQRTCFYENIESSSPSRAIDVFVHSGGNMEIIHSIHGPLEYKDIINEEFEDPIKLDYVNTQKEKVSDSQSYTVEFTAQDSGTYAFCLDNRNARFFAKSVEIDIRNPSAKKIGDITTKAQENQELTEALKALTKIHKGIVNVQQQQQRDRHRLMLHSATNLLNYDHAYYGSLIETSIFIFVSLFQVFFVRRWFASKVQPKGSKNRV